MNTKLLTIFFLSYFLLSFSQETHKLNANLKNQFIEEVYGQLDTNSQLYKNLDNLLTNRVEFKKSPQVKDDKDYENIADFSLFNKYNTNLKRDKKLQPENFNVLKYNLTFYSPYTKVYRFEKSDWLIIIHP